MPVQGGGRNYNGPVTHGGGTGPATAGSTSAPSPSGSGPVQYDIANVAAPGTSAVTAAPAYSALQNAATAAQANSMLNTFFGTGSQYAPMYEPNYQSGIVQGPPPQVTGNAQAASGSVT